MKQTFKDKTLYLRKKQFKTIILRQNYIFNTVWDKNNLKQNIIFKTMATLDETYLIQLTIKTQTYQFKMILSDNYKIESDNAP